MALVLVLMVLSIISLMGAAAVMDVFQEGLMARNLRLQCQAQNWSESGLELAQAILVFARDQGGPPPGWSSSLVFEDTQISVIKTQGGPLWGPDATQSGFKVFSDDRLRCQIEILYLGYRYGQGLSAMAASGYRPLGLNGCGLEGVQSAYLIKSRGLSSTGSRQRASAVYFMDWP
jgi:hypothetical protein